MNQSAKSIIFSIFFIGMTCSHQMLVSARWSGGFSKKVKGAVQTTRSKLALYKRCARGECTQEEKDIVRADWKLAKKKGKKIGPWLVAAVILLGIAIIKVSLDQKERIYHQYPLPPLSDFGNAVSSIFERHLSDGEIQGKLDVIRMTYLHEPLTKILSTPLLLHRDFLELLAHLYYKHKANESENLREYIDFLTKFHLVATEAAVYPEFIAAAVSKGEDVPYEQLRNIIKENPTFREIFSKIPSRGAVKWWHVLGFYEEPDTRAARKAYRALAKTIHPDKHPGDEIYKDLFQHVSSAYEESQG